MHFSSIQEAEARTQAERSSVCPYSVGHLLECSLHGGTAVFSGLGKDAVGEWGPAQGVTVPTLLVASKNSSL